MSERYRYGYGEDFPKRDFPFSRQGAMTDHRDEEGSRRDVDVDERPTRADEPEAEEQQAERMREAHEPDEPRGGDPGATMPFQRVTPERERTAPPAEPQDERAEREAAERDAAEREAAEDEAAGREGEDATTGSSQPDEPEAQRPAATTRRDSIFEVTDEPARERPPIALGPPASSPADADTGAAAEAPAPAAPAAAAEAPPAAQPDAPAPAVGAPAAGAPVAGAPVPGSRASLLASIDRNSIRSRFIDIQAGFVDEPRQAVQEAEQFVDELVRRLVDALESERAKLKATIDDGSTEDLRIALRGYRAFVDRLLNLAL
jgi:hypothetical protein